MYSNLCVIQSSQYWNQVIAVQNRSQPSEYTRHTNRWAVWWDGDSRRWCVESVRCRWCPMCPPPHYTASPTCRTQRR